MASSKKGTLISIGLAVVDLLTGPVTRDLFERDSEPVSIAQSPGGDAVNVCLNAAALGMNAYLASCVGDDAFGEAIRSACHRAGVDTSCLKALPECGTAVSLVLTEPSGERHFLCSQEIFQKISPEQIPEDVLQQAEFLSLNSYFRMTRVDGAPACGLFDRAHAAGVRTAVDTVSCRAGNPMGRIRDVLKRTDIFLPSFEEARQITEKDTPEEMAAVLEKTGVRIFGVKLGAEGSFVTDFDHAYLIPADETALVQGTVGAGDSYFAGFLCALSHGYPLKESAMFASCAAACTVEVRAASGGIRSFQQVQQRFEAYLARHPKVKQPY